MDQAFYSDERRSSSKWMVKEWQEMVTWIDGSGVDWRDVSWHSPRIFELYNDPGLLKTSILSPPKIILHWTGNTSLELENPSSNLKFLPWTWKLVIIVSPAETQNFISMSFILCRKFPQLLYKLYDRLLKLYGLFKNTWLNSTTDGSTINYQIIFPGRWVFTLQIFFAVCLDCSYKKAVHRQAIACCREIIAKNR